MTFDEIGQRHGTDKASFIVRGANFAEFSREGQPIVGHGYLSAYEALLGHRRGEALWILEIGVQRGYGLMTYEDCFERAEVVGIDVAPMCVPSDFRRAELVVMDAYDAAARDRFFTERGDFDLIVDDASHQSARQIELLGALFARVRPGGYYVVEDVECGFEPYYGGNPEGGPGSIVWRLMEAARDALGGRPGSVGVHCYRGIAFLERGPA